jgi:hypothetical protein
MVQQQKGSTGKGLHPEVQPEERDDPAGGRQDEVERVVVVDHGDCEGDLERNGVEVDEPLKGNAFDKMWGIK